MALQERVVLTSPDDMESTTSPSPCPAGIPFPGTSDHCLVLSLCHSGETQAPSSLKPSLGGERWSLELERDGCGLSLINDPLRHLFPSPVLVCFFFFQKKIKRLILIDGICSGPWFYRMVSYKANLRSGKAAWMASVTNLECRADAKCSPEKQM